MIGYVTLGTNDITRAAQFYDALLAAVGGKRMMETEKFIMWSAKPGTPAIALTKPFDGQSATVGNGMMIGLIVHSREEVDRVHAKAIELGAKDEGPVGARSASFYAGYFRDLDGNKLNVFHMG